MFLQLPPLLRQRLHLDLPRAINVALGRFRNIHIIKRIAFFTLDSCQPLRTLYTLRRAGPPQLDILLTIAAKALVRRDADFVCDEDLAKGGDNGGPEDGHRRAHDGETDFEEGDDEDFGVPAERSFVSQGQN